MKKMPARHIIAVLFLLFIHALVLFSQKLTVRTIMAEPSIAGMRVEGERLSPDGGWVAYTWSAAGVEPRDLYLMSTSGGEPRILAKGAETASKSDAGGTSGTTSTAASKDKDPRTAMNESTQRAREQNIAGIDWSPDSKRLLFSKSGDLFVQEIKVGSIPRRITRTAAPEMAARWLPDGHRVLYQSSGNLFVIDVDQTSIIQLTREGGVAAAARNDSNNSLAQGGGNNVAIQSARISNDGSRIAYVVSDTSKQRGLLVPDYTGDFVTAPATRRGWSEQRVQILLSDGSSERAITVSLPPAEGTSYIRGFEWTPDDSALSIDRIDKDTKRRQLFRASLVPTDSTSRLDVHVELIDQETDEKWIAPLSRVFDVSVNGRLFFASERSGFNQLYIRPDPSAGDAIKKNQPNSPQASPAKMAANLDALPLTTGRWEISWARWLPDSEHVVYLSSERSTAERNFFLLDVNTGKSERLDSLPGMNTDPQISKDGGTLLFQHSEWNRPTELYVTRVCPHCRGLNPVQLTHTVPDKFKQVAWVAPQLIDFAAKDGKQVKARIYTPNGFDKAKKYPAVVFVHGAGYLQNVVNGWNTYYREAMFNSLLTERGYVVLDLDYRGSSGYGRDWRTYVYDFLVGLDLHDQLDGIDFIVKNYAVDPRRVGMYGGSYGGFMAEMAAMRAPEHIACAVALRPVADWKNYYASSPVYTSERLGFPDKNADGYKRSSPITYADKLSRPLLILHGMVDDNVPFQDSVQLVQKLIELGKTDYFEVMFYPKENHSFTRADSWTDEYERVLRFFDAHLK
jgi:dipeptidyl aminopeptidase/acylaminoacyl peptidase